MPPLHRRMRARDINEPGRVSTPLELLLDLTFVVAISLLVNAFAGALDDGAHWRALPAFMMTFFSIWWAWNQFTWLASAYDTDDVLYRVFAMVQMAGVLVLASGVPAAFEHDNWVPVTIGYLIMRVGLLASLSRAIRDDTETGRVALRYFIGISVLQVFWLLRLLLPHGHGLIEGSFVILAIGELLVPLWADRAGGVKFHPHHLAERHGLFTLILLGESVLADASAFSDILAERNLDGPLAVAGFSGLIILFGLWWIYFEEPAGELLESRRRRAFFYAYGHYIVFASLALVGSGIRVVVSDVSDFAPVPDFLSAAAISWPVAVFLVSRWVVHVPISEARRTNAIVTFLAALLIAAVPFASPWLTTLGAPIAVAVIVVLLLVATLIRRARVGRSADSDGIVGSTLAEEDA